MSNLVEIKDLPPININQYKDLDEGYFGELSELSKQLLDKPIIHINATASGGGVAEMLRSQVPFERALGLKSKWYTIDNAFPDFFAATKKVHNLLQGEVGELDDEEKSIYLKTNKELGNSLEKILSELRSGIVIIHDPQLLALINHIPHNFPLIFRLHIDISTPNHKTLEFFRPYIKRFSYVVLSNKAYIPSMPWLNEEKVKIIYPAIDPLTDKNRPLSEKIAWDMLEEFEINPLHPLITQVSRFDPWKDPLGVIHAYYLAKNEIPDLQLVLSGFIVAQDDPEAEKIFKIVKKHAKGDPDIFLFADPEKLGSISNDVFINALYTASTIVIQKSIREGFGLTITEAMFKGKPLIAGTTLGSLAQIKHEKNGLLVSTSEETSEAIIKLIKNEKLREKLGKEAHRTASKNFTIPKMILEHLKIYNELS